MFEALDLSGNDQVPTTTTASAPRRSSPGRCSAGRSASALSATSSTSTSSSAAIIAPTADRIYTFGFSRGAFTIRVVIGLILNQGLVLAPG